MNKPVLTIIIPCFNCSKTLEQAFNSCFIQNINGNFEIVMVDDYSTDNTRIIMEKLADGKDNVRLFFHDKNKGGGAARNTAVRNSLSDIIFCLDSDDILPEGTVGRMHRMMIEKNCDGVGINRSIKFKGNDVKNVVIVNEFGYAGKIIPFDNLIEKQGGPYCSLYSTFMFTRKAFEIIGGYSEDHGFDTQSFAWRFLANGLIAYTCPGAEYLHRIHFHKSYYIREYESGKVNHNWFKVFEEFLYLFNNKTQIEILNFDLNTTKNFISDFIIKNNNIFKENYKSYIINYAASDYEKRLSGSTNIDQGDRYWLGIRKYNQKNYTEAYTIFEKLVLDGADSGHIHYYLKLSSEHLGKKSLLVNEKKIENLFNYMKQGSAVNIFTRVIRKIHRIIKNKFRKIYFIRKLYYVYVGIRNNIYQYFIEKESYNEYNDKILQIKKNKEIVFDMDWGGLGDALVYTSLPRLLKEKFNIDFYLSENCKKVFRSSDILKLCFEMNPYFKGFKNTDGFKFRKFSRNRSIINLISDFRGDNIIGSLYKQFGIFENSLPEIYYKPKKIDKYSNVILVDINYISGHKLGWIYNNTKIDNYIKKIAKNDDIVEYVDSTKQDLFTYIDMIYSSKKFVSILSGGAAIAASLNIKSTIFLPQNVRGESVYSFVFKASHIKYIS